MASPTFREAISYLNDSCLEKPSQTRPAACLSLPQDPKASQVVNDQSQLDIQMPHFKPELCVPGFPEIMSISRGKRPSVPSVVPRAWP